MITIVPFGDHQIGFECISYLLKIEQEGKISIPFLITTRANEEGWWQSIGGFKSSKKVFCIEDFSISDFDGVEVDYFLLLSWKYYVNSDWLKIPRINTINLHYSLLPRHRGTNPVNWTLIHGDETTGVTFHEVNNKLDEGRIISQKMLFIESEDSVKKLLNKLDHLAEEQFKKLLHDILNNELTYKSQEFTEEYNSKKKFERKCQLDLDHVGSLREHINLLRGLSFSQDHLLAHTLQDDGKKVYYYLSADKK